MRLLRLIETIYITGMYDGNVAVYNLQTNPSQPLYVSKGVNCKHSDVIWEVKTKSYVQSIECLFFNLITVIAEMGSRYA